MGYVDGDQGRRGPGTIGNRVRGARERKGWNRETLAFHAQVSWSAISQVESGRRQNLRLETLSSLAGALGLSVDYLVTGRASPAPMLEHRALLYGSDEEFLMTAVPFVEQAVQRGEPALVVTTERNAGLLRDGLSDGGAGVQFRRRSDWYATPATTMDAYRSFIDEVVAAGANWVHVVGEVVWDESSNEAAHAWARYETLLNVTLAGAPATIVCPYDTRVLGTDVLDTACATHPELIGSEGTTISARYGGANRLLEH